MRGMVELQNYEIGGIGDIKRNTLRFHSYRAETADGKLMSFAEYDPVNPPKIFRGYPSGQELLIDLCNLYLRVQSRSLEYSADVLTDWCTANLHPYYIYGDVVENAKRAVGDTGDCWDMMVNILECYCFFVAYMVEDLRKLYENTMSVFALRSLSDGDEIRAKHYCNQIHTEKAEMLMKNWYAEKPERRGYVLEDFVDRLHSLEMHLRYDVVSRQTRLEPKVDTILDAAYYGLTRFTAVNAGALDDWGGKTTVAFCEACGRAFIKRGDRQKYCNASECQGIRNSRKSRDYYYRARDKK